MVIKADTPEQGEIRDSPDFKASRDGLGEDLLRKFGNVARGP